MKLFQRLNSASEILFFSMEINKILSQIFQRFSGSGRLDSRIDIDFAACIRCLCCVYFILSNDELSALTRARVHSIAELFPKGIYTDFHPAGWRSLFITGFGFLARMHLFSVPFVLTLSDQFI